MANQEAGRLHKRTFADSARTAIRGFLDTLSPVVRQRLELVFRAYSAAVYAHKNRPQKAQLLSKSHIKRHQEEQILRAFNAECQTALQKITEVLQSAKGNTAAERHALLKDYQLWTKQVADLLKEALFAMDREELVRRLVAIPPREALSRKNGRLQLSETYLNVLSQKIFEPDLYLYKFDKLFISQMQLEQRFSLAIEITCDYIDAVRAAMKKAVRVREKDRGSGTDNEADDMQTGNIPNGEALALALLVQHPNWPDTKIAKTVGVNRTTLYDWRNFKKAKEVLKQGKKEFPKGSKNGETRNVEAWETDT